MMLCYFNTVPTSCKERARVSRSESVAVTQEIVDRRNVILRSAVHRGVIAVEHVVDS